MTNFVCVFCRGHKHVFKTQVWTQQSSAKLKFNKIQNTNLRKFENNRKKLLIAIITILALPAIRALRPILGVLALRARLALPTLPGLLAPMDAWMHGWMDGWMD